MADYTELKAAIRAAIYDNVTQAITGDSLQEILVQMVDELGESYVLPEGGIPATDLAQAVRDALAEAVSAYQLPEGGIPEADLAQAVRNALAAGLSAYQKPSTGIPASDMAPGVIPDKVEANPTVPSGTTPTTLTTMKIGDDYYTAPQGPQGPQGEQGNTGSSVDYPYELVNNLTTDDATKGLSAAQGVVLAGQVSQLGQELNGEIITVTSSDYTKIDGGIQYTDGALKPAHAMWHSSPIRLLSGQTIRFTTNGVGEIPQDAAISTTDVNGTSYIGVVQFSSSHDYSYTAQQDTYVSISYSGSGASSREVNSCTITGKGLIDDVEDLAEQVNQNAEEFRGDIQNLEEETFPNTKDLVMGTDYTVIPGYVNGNGVQSSGDSFWHSSAISVKRGDTIRFTIGIAGSGMAIGRTDVAETYFRVLQEHNSAKDYTVVVDFDGYIAIGYNYAKEDTPRIPTLFTLTSSNLSETLGDSEEYADGNLVYDAKVEDVQVLTSIAKSDDSRKRAAIADALFEREKMLCEIAQMTSADILAQGSCGYTESNGVVTDGTITWKIYKGGILYISGYGKFYDFLKGSSCCKTISEVNAFVTQLGSSLWFYGFIVQNVNGIVPPFPASNQKFNGDAVVYSGKRYVPFGEDTNPLNNLPYGYSAPWYIYRTEYDWNYTSPENVALYNPNGIKYNRICIEEDLTNGGITYLGDWAFYRATAKSLILPSKLTKIGTFGVRYSPNMETVVMGNYVTEIEDHGVSRMEAMRNLQLSDALISVGEGCFESDDNVERIIFPDTLVSAGITVFNGNSSLVEIGIGGLTSIPDHFATNTPLLSVDIKSGVTNIEGYAFYGTKVEKITIPASVASIGSVAFRKCYNLKVVVFETELISLDENQSAVDMSQVAGWLFAYCDWVLIPSANTVQPYFYRGFDLIKDDGTYKYFKRNMEKLSN